MTAIEISGVGLRKGGAPILDGIDIRVPSGSVTCLVGPSGAGKSTLLRAVNGLEPFDDGRIDVGERTVGWTARGGQLRPWTEREAAAHRARVGFVFQDFNLFPNRTALDNVMVAQRVVHGTSRGEAERIAREMLDRVGLSSFAERFPAALSGGQQQRVAIARALAMRPEVMLFDEATSSLDPELGAEVLQVMRELADSGMTMLIVTHELGFARDVADRLVLLENGRIVEQGPAAALFERPARDRTADFLSHATAPHDSPSPDQPRSTT